MPGHAKLDWLVSGAEHLCNLCGECFDIKAVGMHWEKCIGWDHILLELSWRLELILVLLVPSGRYDKKKDFSLKEMITFNIDVLFPEVSILLVQAHEDLEDDGNEDKDADAGVGVSTPAYR
jgi:hypothetical protein